VAGIARVVADSARALPLSAAEASVSPGITVGRQRATSRLVVGYSAITKGWFQGHGQGDRQALAHATLKFQWVLLIAPSPRSPPLRSQAGRAGEPLAAAARRWGRQGGQWTVVSPTRKQGIDRVIGSPGTPVPPPRPAAARSALAASASGIPDRRASRPPLQEASGRGSCKHSARPPCFLPATGGNPPKRAGPPGSRVRYEPSSTAGPAAAPHAQTPQARVAHHRRVDLQHRADAAGRRSWAGPQRGQTLAARRWGTGHTMTNT